MFTWVFRDLNSGLQAHIESIYKLSHFNSPSTSLSNRAQNNTISWLFVFTMEIKIDHVIYFKGFVLSM